MKGGGGTGGGASGGKMWEVNKYHATHPAYHPRTVTVELSHALRQR